MSLTKYIALDCEMVGYGVGGRHSMLARVSIVNYHGECVYDEYVRPTEKVTNYRTPISGIRKEDLEDARDFEEVRKEVRKMLHGRVVVGHSLEYDFEALQLTHPERSTRDTAQYEPFLAMNRNKTPSLRWLAARVLREIIQRGEHSPKQDAAAAMRLYRAVADEWEDSYFFL